MRLWIPTTLAFFALACTSGTSAPDAGGPCPAVEPAAGSACATAGLDCEYAGDGGTACSAVRCTSSSGGGNAWVDMPSPSCGPNPSDCPATFASLAAGAACPLTGASRRCVYAEGACGCAPCLADGGTRTAWKCLPWSAAGPGCPSPRPLVGTACATDQLICDWGQCCSGVSLGSSEQCIAGRWQSYVSGACSCAMPACP